MANAILLNGSLDLTKILEQAHAKHSAFSKAKNGHIYFNITQWVNEQPNDLGQHSSVQLNSTKEARESEGKIYIGNLKKAEQQAPEPITDTVAAEIPTADSLPF